ncbi:MULTISPECIES: class I SAM-dependent methyltransferase [unclassified Alteromonas]|uniref:class I SAM-dependent methyltransferase n=1 Tax=unclassified Alteromonas TaxID=2614992 RepID=UPI0013760B5B|nr:MULTISPECIES: class I SAM-dependent methyltransferase [unclassified Alteromonas]MDO6475704.1 class I SAM-dependent methyltransferase [Alteromonas sp. 1_MG-2023]
MSDESIINENSYNLTPMLYDVRGFFILTLAYRNTLSSQVRFFAENLKGKHLECAIGTGTFTQICMKHARKKQKDQPFSLVGVDYSKALMGGARKKLKGAELAIEDLRNMSFEDETFDTANLPNGYHTIGGIEKAMHEIVRVLKKGGTLYMNVLLYPGEGFMNKISTKVNDYGQSIGILNRPYTREEVLASLPEFGLRLDSEHISQNCIFLKTTKI